MTEPVRLSNPGETVDTLLTTVQNSNLSATHKITRSATLVIAANNSSAKGKAQADYVCDGTNDHHTIQAALDALPATGGTVYFCGGTYDIRYKISISVPNVIFTGDKNATFLRHAQAYSSLTANADISATSIQVSDASGFQPGDKVVVVDDTLSDAYTDRTSTMISTINGNTINLTSAITFAVTTAQNAKIYTSFRMIEVTADDCIIEKITIDGNESNTTYVFPVECESVYVSSSGVTTCNLHLKNTIRHGILYDLTSVNSGCIENNYISTVSSGYKGVDIGGSASRVTVRGNYINNFDICMYSCADIHNVTFANNICDTSGTGLETGDPTTDTILITGNQFIGCQYGIRILNDTVYNGLIANNMFSGHTVGIYSNSDQYSIVGNLFKGDTSKTQEHVYLRECDQILLSNNYMNGIYASSVYCSIRVDKCTNLDVVSNKILSSGRYGIYFIDTNNYLNIKNNSISADWNSTQIGSGTSSNVTLENNKLSGTTVVGSGWRVKNNVGYVTENTGTATITASATTVEVTHGLAAAPTRVLLSPTTATAGKQYYVSAKDATTFTITIDSAAEADITFDWQAVI